MAKEAARRRGENKIRRKTAPSKSKIRFMKLIPFLNNPNLLEEFSIE
jgi:hypothetical protein